MADDHLYHGACEIVSALHVLAGRWKLPILWKLSFGKCRYNELKREVHGITNIMLTRSLKELQEHGLVERIEYDEASPHVEYQLTETGEQFVPLLKELKAWGEKQASYERRRMLS